MEIWVKVGKIPNELPGSWRILKDPPTRRIWSHQKQLQFDICKKILKDSCEFKSNVSKSWKKNAPFHFCCFFLFKVNSKVNRFSLQFKKYKTGVLIKSIFQNYFHNQFWMFEILITCLCPPHFLTVWLYLDDSRFSSKFWYCSLNLSLTRNSKIEQLLGFFTTWFDFEDRLFVLN